MESTISSYCKRRCRKVFTSGKVAVFGALIGSSLIAGCTGSKDSHAPIPSSASLYPRLNAELPLAKGATLQDPHSPTLIRAVAAGRLTRDPTPASGQTPQQMNIVYAVLEISATQPDFHARPEPAVYFSAPECGPAANGCAGDFGAAERFATRGEIQRDPAMLWSAPERDSYFPNPRDTYVTVRMVSISPDVPLAHIRLCSQENEKKCIGLAGLPSVFTESHS